MAIPTGSAHYKRGEVEPLELIEAQDLNFHLGCVVKYAVRAHYYTGTLQPSDALEAVDKAMWYLQRYKEVVLGWKEKEQSHS